MQFVHYFSSAVGSGMKKRAIQVSVAIALVALAIALRGRRARELPDTPEAAVSALFDAADRGDDEAYLALVTGELARSLRSTRSQLGAEAFRQDLRRSAAGIKGLAVARANDAPSGCVAVDVEIVFADRNERQRIVVVPEAGGWAILALGPAATTQPAIPYGTPVYE